MANEIKLKWDTGKTVYVVVVNAAGQFYNTVTPGFEAYNGANWGSYDVALTEQGASGLYFGNFPVIAAGIYSLVGFEQAGGAPATTDIDIADGNLHWDGSAEVALADIPTANENADALLDRTDAVETSLTPRKALRAIAAAAAGELSGAATSEVTIKGAGVETTRITASVDADGNRSAVTLNL